MCHKDIEIVTKQIEKNLDDISVQNINLNNSSILCKSKTINDVKKNIYDTNLFFTFAIYSPQDQIQIIQGFQAASQQIFDQDYRQYQLEQEQKEYERKQKLKEEQEIYEKQQKQVYDLNQQSFSYQLIKDDKKGNIEFKKYKDYFLNEEECKNEQLNPNNKIKTYGVRMEKYQKNVFNYFTEQIQKYQEQQRLKNLNIVKIYHKQCQNQDLKDKQQKNTKTIEETLEQKIEKINKDLEIIKLAIKANDQKQLLEKILSRHVSKINMSKDKKNSKNNLFITQNSSCKQSKNKLSITNSKFQENQTLSKKNSQTSNNNNINNLQQQSVDLTKNKNNNKLLRPRSISQNKQSNKNQQINNDDSDIISVNSNQQNEENINNEEEEEESEHEPENDSLQNQINDLDQEFTKYIQQLNISIPSNPKEINNALSTKQIKLQEQKFKIQELITIKKNNDYLLDMQQKKQKDRILSDLEQSQLHYEQMNKESQIMLKFYKNLNGSNITNDRIQNARQETKGHWEKNLPFVENLPKVQEIDTVMQNKQLLAIQRKALQETNKSVPKKEIQKLKFKYKQIQQECLQGIKLKEKI